jgi:hypothetical protein
LKDAPILEDLTEKEMCTCSLLSLLHLLPRCTQGRELLIDYSYSYVVTSADYLSVLQKKTIDKVAPNHIEKFGLKKRRKNKLGKQQMPNKQQRKQFKKTKKITKAKFVAAWSIVVVSRA